MSNSNDQYQVPKAREMIEELNKRDCCLSTTTLPYRKIPFGDGNYPHSGVLTHICKLEINHNSNCECLCGIQFKGWR